MGAMSGHFVNFSEWDSVESLDLFYPPMNAFTTCFKVISVICINTDKYTFKVAKTKKKPKE